MHWHLTAAELASARRFVSLDEARVPAVIEWLAPAPPNEAWRAYVGPVDPGDLPRLFHELAITISQFGGFIAFRPDGDTCIWKREGSGIRAILATIAAIRYAHRLPGIDISTGVATALSPFLIDVPFASERLAMLEEFATPGTRRVFERLLDEGQLPDKSYAFDALHMAALAHVFPKSFGGDWPFCKKASLLLMTMEIALSQLGHKAVAATPPPADYRIPQILEALGILRFDPQLAELIAKGHLFERSDPRVHAIRAMTVEAFGLIRDAYARHHGQPITAAELDGRLYLLSRDARLMTRIATRPHMLVATPAF